MSENTPADEARNLCGRITSALRALERDDSPTYSESELSGRYDGVWWMLRMALNDATELLLAWKADAK